MFEFLTTNNSSLAIEHDGKKFTYTEKEYAKKRTNEYEGFVFIDMDSLFFDMNSTTRNMVNIRPDTSKLAEILSPSVIEQLNRITQYNRKIVFFTVNEASIKHYEETLESRKSDWTKKGRTFPNYSLTKIDPTTFNCNTKKEIGQLTSSELISGNPLLHKTSQHLFPHFDGSNVGLFAQDIMSVNLRLRTEASDKSGNISGSKLSLLQGIENYLAWRDDKNMSSDFKLGFFSKLRHWTDFGKKRAENLRSGIINATSYEDLRRIMGYHFNDGHSKLHNHSLDTYLLEAMKNDVIKKAHSQQLLDHIENSCNLLTEKGRVKARSNFLENFNQDKQVEMSKKQ